MKKGLQKYMPLIEHAYKLNKIEHAIKEIPMIEISFHWEEIIHWILLDLGLPKHGEETTYCWDYISDPIYNAAIANPTLKEFIQSFEETKKRVEHYLVNPESYE